MIMKLQFNKNNLLSFVLGAVIVLIVARITPVSVDPVIEIVISKNKEPITDVYQTRNIEFHKKVMVDRVDLLHRNRLSHRKLGNIGYDSHFFADIEATFTVKDAGRYRFSIGSDDGFTASVNDSRLCDHPAPRPYQVQNCMVELTEGEHNFSLSYFDATGNSGLTVKYTKVGESEGYFFGEDSRYMTFK